MTLQEITNVTNNLNVLFVEDDATVQNVTQRILSTFFPNIDLASDGKEGLEKFKQNNYDLVITDLAMPKLQGIDMIKQIKKIKPEVYIIILSAMNQPEKVIESMRIGIEGYLFKPLMFDKFLESLENVVQKEIIKNKLLGYDNAIEKELQEKTIALEKQMNCDDLTSFGTLQYLMSKLENIDNFQSPVVILINIDHFRTYNQLYGLKTGNEILLEFSNILKNYNQNKHYELFRINADEFVLLDTVEYLEIEKYENDLDELFKTIENSAIELENIEEKISIEITAGISFSSTQTLKKANMALYEARKRGRNFIGFSYDIDYTQELQENLFWRKEIRNAIADKRVIPFYQPIVNRDQKIVEYESLIRIKTTQEDGEIKYLAPEEFLDLSIMTKQYLTLTKMMIESTFQTIREENVSISINLTYQDIKHQDIYGILKDNIKKYNLEDKTEFDISNGVIFEILEHEGIDCYNTFVEFIQEFKDMGVKIALDDFGTGFSNFSHINTLSPDYIKIDGGLISKIPTDKKSYDLVKAIVKFSSELGIKTVAEHVHSKEVFDMTYDLGIDKFQGYYFGKPNSQIIH
jgi:c-di-GMP phosphodiesterase